MRYTLLPALLLIASCGSTTPPPLDLQVTLSVSAPKTTTSTPQKATGMIPPNPNLNPAHFGYAVGADGAWISGDFVIEVENGLTTEVRTRDGSVRCWDLRFNSGERPDPVQAMQFYYATTHKGLPKGKSPGLEYSVMDMVVGTFNCERA